jgi:hypothetical protein
MLANIRFRQYFTQATKVGGTRKPVGKEAPKLEDRMYSCILFYY